MIMIYDDGHHANAHVHMAVSMVTDTPASFCTASMIFDGCLENTKLLIMPGGADLFYCEKLNGDGNQRIRDFVSQGGSYLGTCAGAYYGCSSLDWNKGEIDGIRELSLSDAQAIGPVYDWVENKEKIYEGSWIKAVEIETSTGVKLLTQYNGGPVFSEGDYDIIARYTDIEGKPPAIIVGKFGEGRYILSSPHIEIFGHLTYDRLYKIYNKSYEREKKEIDKLLSYQDTQKEFFKKIIDQLL